MFPGCDSDDDGFIYNVSGDYYYCRRCHRSGTLSWLMHETIGAEYSSAPKKSKIIAPPEYKNHIPMSMLIKATDDYVDRVASYYMSFGIGIDILDKYSIGWYDNGSASGYFIPQFIDLQEAGTFIMGAEIRCAWPAPKMKFYSIDGSVRGGFHQSQYVSIPGYTQGPKLPYLFLCEAVKDAMVLETMGFYATAFKPEYYWNSVIDVCLENVETVIWMQDNDWKYNSGLRRDESAGKDMVDRFCKNTKREVVRMSTPNHKQPSDMAADVGIQKLNDWILEEKPWLEDIKGNGL